MTPTQRSLKHLREQGQVPEVVQRWNSFARKSLDLWGFLDIISLNPTKGEIVGVQATSLSNVAARIKKITAHPNLSAVRACGIRILVQGWGKDAKGKIRLREVDVS
jgi:hypothetical protein